MEFFNDLSRLNRKQIDMYTKKFKIRVDLFKSYIKWFGIELTLKILSMTSSEILSTCRVNLSLTSREEVIDHLADEKIIAEPINIIPEMINVIKGREKIGNSITYLTGEISPQGLGSQLAVHSLNPLPNEKILDMAAAPGGKSTFIAERMKGKGCLVSNDPSSKRLQSLISNFQRHNLSNYTIMQSRGEDITIDAFDKILLDAPCSGDGLIVSKPHQIASKSLQNSYDLQKMQISLLKKSIKLLKKGGVCIYSTCALNPIENEQVVLSVIDDVRIKQINIPGLSGFTIYSPSFINSKRLLPPINKCDGFFIVKLQKK